MSGFLTIENFLNAYNSYKKNDKKLHIGLFVGYFEACLVNFGVIPTNETDLSKYAKTNTYKILWLKYTQEEGRIDIIIRLTE